MAWRMIPAIPRDGPYAILTASGKMKTMGWTHTTVLSLFVALCMAGCGDDVEQMTTDEIRKPAKETVHTVDTPPAVTAKRLVYKLPAGWRRVEPEGTFRYAQIVLPLAEGDTGEAQLVVYWRIGGGVEANVRRWIGEKATIATRKINGLSVTTLDISGNHGSSMTAGVHARGKLPNARLLAAVVEVPGGDPYFIKAVGPVRTMAAVASDYEAFLASIRAE